VLWVTYLGLEPYVRRRAPDSLIGWTRLIGGQWQDSHVGRDVLIGISAGMAMTLFAALHNILPLLAGQPEPMPLLLNVDSLVAVRHAVAFIVRAIDEAVLSAMLGTVGFIALAIVFRRRRLGIPVAILLFTPVAVNGMFMPGTPALDLVIGALIIAAFVITIVRFGLLAGTAALATHFIMLRAPVTVHLGAWWATAGVISVCVIAAATLAASSFALRGAR
jgi:hypothetical protein